MHVVVPGLLAWVLTFSEKKGVTLEVHPQNPSSGLNRIGAACFYVMFKAATRTKKRSLSERT